MTAHLPNATLTFLYSTRSYFPFTYSFLSSSFTLALTDQLCSQVKPVSHISNMSFFGFDPTKPPDHGPGSKAPGFGPAPDPFAGLTNRNDSYDDDDGAIDFEETYDGLGEDLDESGDALNDATFGGSGPVGKDFDFAAQAGHTSKKPAQPLPSSQPSLPKHPSPQYQSSHAFERHEAPRAAKSGYEKYSSKSGAIPDLTANASIWQQPPPSQPKQSNLPADVPSISAVTKKMMSLDEVEAAMRSQSKKSSASGTPQPPRSSAAPPPAEPQPRMRQDSNNLPPAYTQQTQVRHVQPPVQDQQRSFPPRGGPQPPHSPFTENGPRSSMDPALSGPMHNNHHIRGDSRGLMDMLQRPQVPSPVQPNFQGPPEASHGRTPSNMSVFQPEPPGGHLHSRGASMGGRFVTHPDQLAHLTDEERSAILMEEANRAKRNHKIHLLSKDNGLMTPQDKNFITRIQLQQLVAATGGIDEQGPDGSLNEDFYHQVYSQIRGAPRQEDQLNQTYLNQLAWRGGNRRYPRGGENHMRRMEQQVQRAVEAAKARPKNNQLVVEGSLGKISFSNAKTPKPLLNIRKQDHHDPLAPANGRPRVHESVAGQKAVLRDIENIYATLIKMEDHERKMPPQPTEESSGDEIQGHMDWRAKIREFNLILWTQLKVMEPIGSKYTCDLLMYTGLANIYSPNMPHPFIAILSHPKGKKLIPRVFRQIEDQQRLTILTMLVVHLDNLDIVSVAQPSADGQKISQQARDDIELFHQAVMPSLFAFVGDATVNIITGLIGLIADRVNLRAVVQTRSGVDFMTMLSSRAQIIKQGGHFSEAEWNQWLAVFKRFFDALEPVLPDMFLGTVNANDDKYAWQFLAAMGVDAAADQQQRLVIAVKDMVMETVQGARKLPQEQGQPMLDNVNLFMRAIGLDVDLLD